MSIYVQDSIAVRSMVRLAARRQGERRPTVEQVVGDDLHRKSGKWMKLRRIIDRLTDRYQESVVDPETGQIVHECDEPLSEHRGHGSDRKGTLEARPDTGVDA